MANLYGVANPNPPAQGTQTIGGANVNIPAGVETNFTSAPATLPTAPGVYYPISWGWVTLGFSATPPTAMIIGMRLNAGADLQSYFVSQNLFVASGTIMIPVGFYQPQIVYSYPIGVVNFQLSINSGTNGCTVGNIGTLIWNQWVRAPDQ